MQHMSKKTPKDTYIFGFRKYIFVNASCRLLFFAVILYNGHIEIGLA